MQQVTPILSDWNLPFFANLLALIACILPKYKAAIV